MSKAAESMEGRRQIEMYARGGKTEFRGMDWVCRIRGGIKNDAQVLGLTSEAELGRQEQKLSQMNKTDFGYADILLVVVAVRVVLFNAVYFGFYFI